MKNSVVTFNTKLPKLSVNEKKVLKCLIDAGTLIAEVYQKQKDGRSPGANFYPHGISREEVLKAAEKNPNILSPYTIVEQKDGKLVATPYHKKYAEDLKPVAEKLLQAAKLTENKEFARRLTLQAKALLDGSYEKAAVAWMTMEPPYVLDITIGPIERYNDKLFFVKTSYQAWVGVMNREETKKVSEFKEIFLSSRRKVMMPSEQVSFFDKVQTRVDKTVLFSGLIADFRFTGTNLPNETHLMEKYGSEITLFEPSLDYWFVKKHYPIFRAVFEERFQQSYERGNLRKGSMYNILLHELAHSFVRFRNAEKRLGDLFPVIDEIAASVMGIKACGSLILKDVMSQKEFEHIMVMFIVRLFDWLDELEDDPSVIHYVRGNAIALCFLISSGALKQSGGISWPNFTKMFVAMDELASVLGKVLAHGTRSDAESLIKKYGSLVVFNRFKDSLKKGGVVLPPSSSLP